MARPKNKEELIILSEENYDKLVKLIESIPSERQEDSFNFEDRDENIRDILIHLYEWQAMFFKWYEVGMKGEKPIMPREGYTWKTTSDMNYMIKDMYKDTSLEESRKLLEASHKKIMKLIKGHTDDELFTKKYYEWTNTTSLGSYLISATSSHYDWAIKKLKKHCKIQKELGLL